MPSKPDPRYEVVTDTWGAFAQYQRGDRVLRSQLAPGFDADWALAQGSIREVGPDEPEPEVAAAQPAADAPGS